MLPSDLIQLAKERIAPYPCEGFLSGQGAEHPLLFFVGEAPGETEIHNGIPFSGRAGKEFDLFLERAGVSRNEIYVTSTVRSRPYVKRNKQIRGVWTEKKYNRTPNAAEILAHAPVLDFELERAEPDLIVALGRIAWERLTGSKKKISEVAGNIVHQPVRRLQDLNDSSYVYTEKRYSIFPTYHPASVFYNPSLRPVIEEHAYAIRKLISR